MPPSRILIRCAVRGRLPVLRERRAPQCRNGGTRRTKEKCEGRLPAPLACHIMSLPEASMHIHTSKLESDVEDRSKAIGINTVQMVSNWSRQRVSAAPKCVAPGRSAQSDDRMVHDALTETRSRAPRVPGTRHGNPPRRRAPCDPSRIGKRPTPLDHPRCLTRNGYPLWHTHLKIAEPFSHASVVFQQLKVPGRVLRGPSWKLACACTIS